MTYTRTVTYIEIIPKNIQTVFFSSILCRPKDIQPMNSLALQA